MYRLARLLPPPGAAACALRKLDLDPGNGTVRPADATVGEVIRFQCSGVRNAGRKVNVMWRVGAFRKAVLRPAVRALYRTPRPLALGLVAERWGLRWGMAALAVVPLLVVALARRHR